MRMQDDFAGWHSMVCQHIISEFDNWDFVGAEDEGNKEIVD